MNPLDISSKLFINIPVRENNKEITIWDLFQQLSEHWADHLPISGKSFSTVKRLAATYW